MALDNVTHPRVRALALQLRGRNDWWRSSWIGLLRYNYQSGDHRLIEDSVRLETDEEAIHNMAWDLFKLVDDLDRPELSPSLELLYDRNPCAECRGRIVCHLHKLHALPDWIIEECRHDSDENTRAFIAALDGGS
jgi:hypothetical protein